MKPSKLVGIVLLLLLAASAWIWVALCLEMTFTQLGAGLLGLAIGAWRIVPLLVAQPTMAVNYLAQANQASKPPDYDPEHDAAPHYETLLSQFVPLPEKLRPKHRSWPADMHPEECRALEQWAPVNESALLFLAQATGCPYWWYELRSTDGTLSDAKAMDHERVRNCVWGVLLLAKYKASQGDIRRSLQLLADVHMLGVHLAKGARLVEQIVSTAICNLSYGALLAVLDHCQVDSQMLQWALGIFAARIPEIVVLRYSEMEHLYGQDSTQRLFTDDGKGNGRLIPRQLYRANRKLPKGYVQRISFPTAVWICLSHPDRRETGRLAEECLALTKDLARQTPWDLHVRGTSYEKELSRLVVTNFLLRYGHRFTGRCIRMSWQCRVSGHATIAILAVLAYKAREARLPESLGQLVDTGLLPSVPMDPYSGEPLVYKVNGDSFTLYSVGEDCVDSGGVPCEWNDQRGGDHVFWPIPARQQ